MRNAILFLLLGACTSLVPTTVQKLSGVTPLNADPAVISVSVDIPDGLGFMPDSAFVVMRAQRKDTDQVSEEQYILEQLASGDTHVFQIAPQDYTRMRTQQTLISGWKADANDDVTGSLNVTFGGCSLGKGPNLNDSVSISIRTYADGPYLPLMRDVPIKTVLRKMELDTLEPCAENGL